MIKKIALACAITLLVGCSQPQTPEQMTRYKRQQQLRWTNWVNDLIYDVCVDGVTYLYRPAGNADLFTVKLDRDTKVIPCKEAY